MGLREDVWGWRGTSANAADAGDERDFAWEVVKWHFDWRQAMMG